MEEAREHGELPPRAVLLRRSRQAGRMVSAWGILLVLQFLFQPNRPWLTVVVTRRQL